MKLGTKQDDAYQKKVRIFRFVDFEELWPLILGLLDKFSPQIRLIRTFLDRYNNGSYYKYRLEHCVEIAA
jgi:hypothetical protein